MASRVRNATMQVRGKPADQLPRDARERAAVAAILRTRRGSPTTMVNDYLRDDPAGARRSWTGSSGLKPSASSEQNVSYDLQMAI